METMVRSRRSCLALVVILTLPALASCETAGSDDLEFSAGSESEVGSERSEGVPPELAAVLARVGVQVEDDSFASGLSAEESRNLYAEAHNEPDYESPPRAYAVTITSSSSHRRLEPGLKVRMVHVGGVPEVPSGMPPGPGSAESTEQAMPATITTDLLAFFDAHDGRHLMSTYVGQTE